MGRWRERAGADELPESWDAPVLRPMCPTCERACDKDDVCPGCGERVVWRPEWIKRG